MGEDCPKNALGRKSAQKSVEKVLEQKISLFKRYNIESTVFAFKHSALLGLFKNRRYLLNPLPYLLGLIN